MKPIFKNLLLLFSLFLVCETAQAKRWSTEDISPEPSLPKGVVLNLDFQNIQDGLIPSKSLFPLYVPFGELKFGMARTRRVLLIDPDEKLLIPHSSVLDPNGKLWVTSIQLYARANGIVVSQCNQTNGYVIYIADGVVHAAIHNEGKTVVLREKPGCGLGKMFNKQVTVVLQIKPDGAFLFLNRNVVAYAPLKKPFLGKNFLIQIGKNKHLLPALKKISNLPKQGFSGAVATFKIIRQ